MAFVGVNAGEPEVYVLALPILGAYGCRLKADSIHLGPDGRELFFQNPRGEIMRAASDGIDGAILAQLFGRAAIEPAHSEREAESPFDVSADGRFLVNCLPADARLVHQRRRELAEKGTAVSA